MREIKLQFWDTRCEQMFDFDPYADAPVLAGDIPECILRQFTGLKDRNGVEIFEGDILEITTTFHTYPISVKRHDGCFTLAEDGTYGCLDEWADSSLVIGNIYKNPQLLKESE